MIQLVKHSRGGNHVAKTISKPAIVHSMVAAVEALKPPPPTPLRGGPKCGDRKREPTTFELRFRAAPQGELATLVIVDQCQPSVSLSVSGGEQPRLSETACLQSLIQGLLGPFGSRGRVLREATLTCQGRARRITRTR